MSALRVLIGIAAVLVSLVVLRQMADVFVIFLQALFLAAVAQGPIRWLVSRRVKPALAIVLTLTVMVLSISGVAYLVGSAVRSVVEKVPEYGQRADGLLHALAGALLKLHIHVPPDTLASRLRPELVLSEAGRAVSGLGGMVFHEVFMFLMVVFLLIEFQRLPTRIEQLSPSPESTLYSLRSISLAMTRYIGVKTVIAGCSAFLSWISLLLIGVDQALLWAVLTFLLNYIPNVGPILSAIPPSLFALFENGPVAMLWVVLAYLIIKMIFGNILGPGLLGKHLNLSPVAILLSIGLWGWAFGSTGIFLGVPITAALRLVLERNPSTRWFAVLISENPDRVPAS
jgi:predicted PurR-regulated permease PerM